VLGNSTVLVAVNNTPVVVLAERTHAASSWSCGSLSVSLDSYAKEYVVAEIKSQESFTLALQKA